jgi:hypothetical protein
MEDIIMTLQLMSYDNEGHQVEMEHIVDDMLTQEPECMTLDYEELAMLADMERLMSDSNG